MLRKQSLNRDGNEYHQYQHNNHLLSSLVTTWGIKPRGVRVAHHFGFDSISEKPLKIHESAIIIET
jgi:hypothetical protein